jgi:translation initiation factor 2 alpha subunit (eIF-2alpha)
MIFGQNHGDLVMATNKHVMDYGCNANLDEYNRRGFLHISEISSAAYETFGISFGQIRNWF